jgi:hypothetical protein
MTAKLEGRRVSRRSPIPDEVFDERHNRCGRARAMTVFTPVRPVLGVLFTKAVFIFARWNTRKPGSIQELSFIHFARWGLVRRIPDYGQPRERLRQPLFMFESNYNGSFEQYIDAFAHILTLGMTLFWGSSYGFPRPKPVTRFKAYIRANEFVVQHYYSAYPAATATMVVSALGFRPGLDELRRRASSMSADEFAARYRALLKESQAG